MTELFRLVKYYGLPRLLNDFVLSTCRARVMDTRGRAEGLSSPETRANWSANRLRRVLFFADIQCE